MLKPIDIQNTDFKRSLKGYNEVEVDEFVSKIVTHYESLYQENKRLTQEVAALKEELSKKESQEQDVLDLISLTKQTASEIKELSKRQAEGIVADAERQAKELLADAQFRLEQVTRMEKVLKTRVRSVMESVWATLNADEQASDQGDTLVYHGAAATSEKEEGM